MVKATVKKEVLSRKDIGDLLASKQELTKAKGSEIVDAVIDIITDAIGAGKEVKLTSFGVFTLHKAPARNGRNPKTGEAVKIAARRSLKFKASNSLRNL